MTLPIDFKCKYNENLNENCFDIDEKNETYVCNVCGKNFFSKASFTVHVNSHNFIRNSLGGEKNERETQNNTCNICLKKFTAKKNLLKHLRDVHKNYSEAERMVVKKIKCPERNCEFLCRMMKELRDHIEKCHKIKILKDTLQFPSETVFQKWKKEEESNTVSWFVTGRKKTTLMDGTKKQTLYCHRTGHYSPKGFGKYRMRSVGSCKIGVTCPAAMEVIESPDGGLTVIYYKTHLGHMQDVVYLKLSREERANLADKIKQGFTFDAILEDVKESRDFDREKNKRIHLLSKKDLYGIMRTANCNKKTVKKRHKKETNSENIFEPEENKVFQENSSVVEGMQDGKTEGSINQSFNIYPSQSVVSSHEKDSFGESTNLVPHQNLQKDINIPQSSREGITSQIVILSPDFEYTSVAEIILLPSSGTNAQPTIISQTKASEVSLVQKEKSQTEMVSDLILQDKNKTKKANLYLQLKEKLQKISELLPQFENLTPKQFDLINAKLNGVLDIFNVANAKASARKQTSKKKLIKKNKVLKSDGKIDSEIEYKVQENLLGQQLYDSPLIYAVYN